MAVTMEAVVAMLLCTTYTYIKTPHKSYLVNYHGFPLVIVCVVCPKMYCKLYIIYSLFVYALTVNMSLNAIIIQIR